MQQIWLFKNTDIINIKKWNISLNISKFSDNQYIADLSLPSWKFIIKYIYENKKIISLEILDCIWYLYLWKWIIITIKNILLAILNK